MKTTSQTDTPKSEQQQRASAMAEGFMMAAVERGMHITPDGRVSEADAAELLGIEHTSMKNLRHGYQGPSFYQRGAGKGTRVSYRFDDLVAWLERGRVDL